VVVVLLITKPVAQVAQVAVVRVEMEIMLQLLVPLIQEEAVVVVDF
jgi:hypothetical protein